MNDFEVNGETFAAPSSVLFPNPDYIGYHSFVQGKCWYAENLFIRTIHFHDIVF